MLSGCTLSDMIVTTDKTGNIILTQTGIVATGSANQELPLSEDLSGDKGIYFPVFQ
jgi:hypothetical protein